MRSAEFLKSTLAVACVIAVPALAQAQIGRQVGVAAGVTGEVRLAAGGTGAAGGIQSGQAVNLGDRVTTGPGGRLQIMLLDETIFTIGPNAALTVDEFVFDAASGRGKVTADIARGAFRFVTGRIAANNPQDMKVTMPVGTMGIRGTVVAGRIEGDRALVVLLGPGSQNNASERMGRVLVSGIDTKQGEVELRRPGFATEIVGRAGRPSDPFRLAQNELDGILTSLSNARHRTTARRDAPERVAAIEPAAGGGGGDSSSATGGSGQGTVDGLRGISSFSEVVRDFQAAIVTPTDNLPSVRLADRLSVAMVSAGDLSGYSGKAAFPVQVFGLTGAGSLPGSFAVETTFDFGSGRALGTLAVDVGGKVETFKLEVSMASLRASARGARFAGAPAASAPGNSIVSGSVPGVPIFAFDSKSSEREISYRYSLMRSTARGGNVPGSQQPPDQLLTGLTYDKSGLTAAHGVGIGQLSGVALGVDERDRQRALDALGLKVKR